MHIMLQKRLLFALILLMMACSAYGIESESIFEGRVANGEIFEVKNVTYRPSMFNDNQKLLLIFGEISLNIDIGLCEAFNSLEFCFKSATYWYTNHTQDQNYYKAQIDVRQLIAKLELTRSISETDIKVGEEIRIRTIIKNIGSEVAENINFTDAFPDNLSMDEITACTKEGNTATFKGALEPLEQIQCDYTLKGIDKEAYSSVAKLTYFNGLKNITLQSSSENIKVEKHKIEVTANEINKYFDVNDTYDFWVKINNTAGEDRITVKITIQFDEGVEITTQPADIPKKHDYYEIVYALDPKQAHEYVFPLRFRQKGKITINAVAEYNLGTIKNRINKTFSLQVQRPEIIIPINATIPPEPENITMAVVINNTEEPKIEESTQISAEEDDGLTVSEILDEHGKLILIIALFVIVDIAIGFSIYKKMRD